MMHNKEILMEWFNLFKFILEEEDLKVENIWNMDEIGFRVGCLSRKSLIVTRKEVKKAYLADPRDRTLVISVECISALGELLNPLFILLQKVFLPWFFLGLLLDDYQLAHSDSGYNNSEIALEWLKHFERESRPAFKELVENEWLKHSGIPFQEAQEEAPKCRPKRLLLLDGHESHINVPFIDFAEAHSIIILALSPHSIHLIQPLDVGVFQPLKGAYSRVLEIEVRAGETVFGKAEFMKKLYKIRVNGIKRYTIITSWGKVELIPYNPEIVLSKIKELDSKKASPTTLQKTQKDFI
jgi:hypothetical protein